MPLLSSLRTLLLLTTTTITNHHCSKGLSSASQRQHRQLPPPLRTINTPTMPSDLPYAADAEESLSREELDVLKRQYEKEQATGHVSVQVRALARAGTNEVADSDD